MSLKFFTFLFLLLIVESFGAAVYEAKRNCIPGKSYFDGCNTCLCEENGGIICTLKYCEIIDPKTGTRKMAEYIPPPDNFWSN